ncbi:MAG: D-alanyl-D-alanine carboxypeptidase [Bacilli bacterium]|nr:D-alanyl-D-alanine carboxypeptidase [Bacilli bacterium]
MKKFLLLLILLLLPFKVFALEDLVPNSASSILIEADSGKIIYEKEKDKRVSVASMTKMVAQIIILEEIEKGHIKWSDVVTVSRNASGMGGSQIYLEEGEKITIEDLMKGISVASGNDATVAMAEVISGSEEKFVKKMNQKIKELGLKNTHFSNCTGLDTDDHYSSSYDMAMIARDLVVNHSEILRFSSIYEDYLREDTDRKFWLVNTNKLISFYDGADGLKTGHTDAAGYCLAATAKRNDLRLIAIVLGEKDSKVRNAETVSLLDYGFNNVKLKKIVNKGSVVKKIEVNKANKDIINVKLKNNLNVVENSGINNKKYKFNVKVNDIKLPIKKDSVVGKIEAIYKNKVVSTGELIVDEDIEELSYLELLKENLMNVVFGNI